MPAPVLHCRDDVLRMLDELYEARQEILMAVDKLSPKQLADPVIPGTWTLVKNLQHLAWAEEFILAWVKKRPAVLPVSEYPAECAPDFVAIKTAFVEALAAAIAFFTVNL